MRIMAVANHKGGSGKTTTTVNLAAALVELGRRVLVLDLDPQASASRWLGVNGTASGAADLLGAGANLGEVVNATGCDGLDLVQASPSLAATERLLAREVGAETILRRRLEAAARTRNHASTASDAWDYLLIDCPPSAGLLTLNALAAASELLLPVEAHVMGLQGVAQIMETLDVVRERLNPQLQLTGIVACRVDARTRHAQEVVEQLRSRFGDLVYATCIRENVRLAEAPSFGEPILRYDGRSAGAADYRSLALEVRHQEKGNSTDGTP
jgi:chromosome partitioning protein